jgi:hypothetical protein
MEQDMKSLGGYLFFFGVGSIVLYFLNMEFIILAWVDHWGPTVGWSIRGAMIAVGGILWLIARNQEKSASQ